MGQDFYEMQHRELNSAAQAAQKSTHLRRNRLIFTGLLIITIMSWFCAMTPWVSDDHAFSSIYPGCTGLWDMQVLEYHEWSGKFIGHFMSRVLLREACLAAPPAHSRHVSAACCQRLAAGLGRTVA